MEYYGCGLPWGKYTIEWVGVVSDIFVAVCPSILVHFPRKTQYTNGIIILKNYISLY